MRKSINLIKICLDNLVTSQVNFLFDNFLLKMKEENIQGTVKVQPNKI